MKKSLLFSVPVMATVIFLQACGGGSSGGTQNPTNSNSDAPTSAISSGSASSANSNTQSTELEGTWKKLCAQADDGEHYDIVTVTFTRNTLSSNIENYEDSSCTIPLSYAPNPTASGTFIIGATVTLADATQAKELDSHIDTYAGAPFDIDEYGLYRIENDLLYIEKKSEPYNGTTPQLRPNTLDYNRPFHRQ